MTERACRKKKLTIIVTGAIVLIPYSTSRAETIVINPSCGIAGVTKVCISGSGWPEPQPPCRYRFFFDGARPGELASDQQDGLFGPPVRSFTVPAGTAAGDHTITVDLLENDNNKLLGGPVNKPFKVVTAIQNPWTNPPAGSTINIKFDPTNVCDVTPCSKIVFIQVKQPLGVKSDGTGTRPLTHKEQGFPNAAALDADLNNGRSVDYTIGEKDPYYNGDDPGDIGGVQGLQDGTPKAATMNDTPNRSDANYPPDISTIQLNFEVAAFCAAGDNAGDYLGKLVWSWQRAKGATGTTGTISGVSFDRTQPSQGFKDAVTTWNNDAAHPFTKKFPMTKPSPCP